MIESLDSAQPPLQLRGPFKKATYRGEMSITREFPVAATPELIQALGLDDSYIEPDGTIEAWPHEIIIDIDSVDRSEAEPSVGWGGTFTVEKYTVRSMDGLALTKEDAAAVAAYVGDLTDEENNKAAELDDDNFAEPDDFY